MVFGAWLDLYARRSIKMTMTPVDSSQIKAMGHSGEVMRIEFHSGAEWEYIPVTHEEFKNLLHAPSVGKAFNSFKRSHAHSERRVV